MIALYQFDSFLFPFGFFFKLFLLSFILSNPFSLLPISKFPQYRPSNAKPCANLEALGHFKKLKILDTVIFTHYLAMFSIAFTTHYFLVVFFFDFGATCSIFSLLIYNPGSLSSILTPYSPCPKFPTFISTLPSPSGLPVG